MDVVYNHTGGGQSPRADAFLQRHRQRELLPASSRIRPRLLHGLHRHGQHAEHAASARAAARDGFAALFVPRRCHVDGFRFDLASTLARELHEVDKLGGFFDIIHQDPVLSQVKLIAEPWDVGEGGYQVGNFPVRLGGVERQVSRLRARLLEGRRCAGRRACRAAHWLERSLSEMTAAGLTPASISSPRTTASRCTIWSATTTSTTRPTARTISDGDNNNHSWNCGAEGPTDDAAVNALRRRQKRNFLATLFLSQGVPMLCGGDEYGRTQQGNNNAYCQDNEISLVRLGTHAEAGAADGVHRAADRLPARAPDLPPAKIFPGPRSARRRA